MSDNTASALLEAMAIALELPHQARARIGFVDEDRFLLLARVGTCSSLDCRCCNGRIRSVGLRAPFPPVSVSYRSASLWFGWSIKP